MLTLQVVGPCTPLQGPESKKLACDSKCCSSRMYKWVWSICPGGQARLGKGKGPKNPVFWGQQPKVPHPAPDWGRAEGPEVGSRARPLSQLEQLQRTSKACMTNEAWPNSKCMQDPGSLGIPSGLFIIISTSVFVQEHAHKMSSLPPCDSLLFHQKRACFVKLLLLANRTIRGAGPMVMYLHE